jgi:hypothetical protein
MSKTDILLNPRGICFSQRSPRPLRFELGLHLTDGWQLAADGCFCSGCPILRPPLDHVRTIPGRLRLSGGSPCLQAGVAALQRCGMTRALFSFIPSGF